MGKLHIWDREQLTRSVLEGIEITAVCGYTKTHSRSDIDSAVESSVPVCKGCSSGVAERAKRDTVVLNKPEGWTRLLEDVHRTNRANNISIRVTGNVTSWSFPLAG